jgi:hypothetical protein
VAGNYVSQFYSFAIKAIRDMQHKLQTEFNADVQEVEGAVKELLAGAKDSSSAGATITEDITYTTHYSLTPSTC